MVKQLLFIVFVLLLFMTACKDEPVLVKEDSQPENPNKKPEIVEQQQDGEEEEIDEFIEFTLPDEKVMINLKMVPILDEYLHAAKDPQQVIERMNIERISITNDNLYLLKFSCQNNLCSYMVLDQTKDNQAYLIADLAKIKQMEVSPEETKIFFHFDRNIESPVPPSDIVVIDLEKWEPLTLENQRDDKKLLDYNWPIITADWKDDQTISVTVPDTEETNLLQWYEGNKRAERINFFIKDAE